MNRIGILVGAFDPDDIRVLGEMVHYLDFSPNIFIIFFAKELSFGDGFAGVGMGRGLISTKKSGAELTLAELLAKGVEVSKVLGPVRKNPFGL